MTKLLIKTILPEDGKNNTNSLLNSNFYIKDYQRGYRWEAKQIQDLLDDLNNFDDKNHKLKYCLQPLIVKPIKEIASSRNLNKILNINCNNEITNKNSQNWELIDGQQRLTTIWLILTYCDNKQAVPYSIYYETERNIDKYYLNESNKAIENWFSGFEKKDDIKKNIKQKINNAAQFIWYEVSNETDSEDIFQKINNGKIALTNAELFKAQLLNIDSLSEEDKTNVEEVKNYVKQIAFEWDKIEQSLNDDNFWSFLSNEEKGTRSQIDFLLELRAKQLKQQNLIDENISERDNLFSFLAINSYLNNKNDNKGIFEKQIELWEEIVQIHDTLRIWYNGNNDNENKHELYHYIGFLIAVEKKDSYLESLISEIKGLKKSEIREKILKDVKKEFENINLDELDYPKDKEKIKKVLLFFNVYTMIQSKTDSKFPFIQYKHNKWDIEHIHARATDQELAKLKDPESMIELLEELKTQFEQIGYKNQIKEIDNFISKNLNDKAKRIDGTVFSNFYIKMTDVCGVFDENSLRNLTLLDDQTNRSYQNALFPTKRAIIIERDKGEVFIPVCTKNVFLKMYSKNVTDYMKWSKKDAEDYFNAIKETLEEGAKLWK